MSENYNGEGTGLADLLHITMGDLLDEVVSRQGDRKGVIYPEKNLRWTYRQFRDECNRAAKGLMKLGLKKGRPSRFGPPTIPNGWSPSLPPARWAL